MNPVLPLASSGWDESEVAAIEAVVAGGRFTMGERVREFEESFAAWVGARYAVMVNSGSSANLLAVATAVLDPEIDLGPGDEVVVTAVSWATTYYPLAQYGLRPVLVDVDRQTLNVDVDAVRAAVSPRTRAVLAVNLLGNPNDFDALTRLCDERGLLLLEDNCESLGATYGGRAAGTFGRLGTFSFFFSHHMSTMEGGAIVTDHERHYHMLQSLRSHGWTRGLPEHSALAEGPRDGFHDLFTFVLPGYNVRPLELSGAIGLCQLKKLDSFVEGRRRNAARFASLMNDVPGVSIQSEVGRSSWFGLAVLLREHLAGRRSEVVRRLTAAGVETRPVVAGNFARSPVMRHLDAVVHGELTVADEIHADGFYVGNGHLPRDEGLAVLAEVLRTTR